MNLNLLINGSAVLIGYFAGVAYESAKEFFIAIFADIS
jgi:hypothetical protein